MRLHTLRIPCNDLAASEEFYSNLLGFEKVHGSASAGCVGYKIENSNILLEPEEAGEFEAGSYLGFSLEVPDLDQFYEACSTRGGKFLSPPERQAWGGVMTHLLDPSGNSFSIVEIL